MLLVLIFFFFSEAHKGIGVLLALQLFLWFADVNATLSANNAN